MGRAGALLAAFVVVLASARVSLGQDVDAPVPDDSTAVISLDRPVPGVISPEEMERLRQLAEEAEARRGGERLDVLVDKADAPDAPDADDRDVPLASAETAVVEDDTLSGSIPGPDALYVQLMAGVDTTAMSDQTSIEYQGQRLFFYPESEIFVIDGDVRTEQSGTVLSAAGRLLYRSREGIVEAFDQVTIQSGQSEVRADSLFYDRSTGAVATYGVTSLSEGVSHTEGADLAYDLNRQSGRLGRGVTTYAPWILEGQMDKIGATTYHVEEGHFTTCDLEEPHYRFVSDEIKLRQGDVIVASPVVLYFSDIPVFFLPWYVEPVERGRHSGFLRPQIGISSLIFGSGKERNVQDLGFYYVFNEFADAKLAADWYTESRFILRSDLRYNQRNRFRGDAHFETVWNRIDDSQSRLIRYRHDHTFSRATRASVDVNWSDERSFLRDNSFDPEEILQRSFRSAANYSTRFSWGSLVAGADADFRLDQNRTDFRLPDVRLSISQRPLWGSASRGAAGQNDQKWFERLQYSANISAVGRLSRGEIDSLGNPVTSTSTDSLGLLLEGTTETITNTQEGRARFTLNGPLNLFGVINANPSLSYSTTIENDELADGEKLGGTGQLTTGISFSSSFFRIFNRPVGPFQKMRHKIRPALSFNYAPAPNLWGSLDTESGSLRREQMTANLSLQQDWDVKVRERSEHGSGDGAGDAGAEVGDATQVEGEIRTRTINLLSVTNSLGFDFVRNRGPEQIGFSTLSTRIGSGVGRSFSLSMTMNHDLVKRSEAREVFNPFMSSLNTDFSINGRGSVSRPDPIEERGAGVVAGRGDEERTEDARRQLEAGSDGGGIGPWSLQLTHSWSRVRDGDGRQSLGIGTRFLPSPGWSLNYRTNYDITKGELQGQTLALVRDMHDWQATLNVSIFPSDPQDRVLIQFSVFLRDAPDLNLPYRIRRE